MKNETWKDIIGYEGYYSISNLGRVRCLKKSVRGVISDRIAPKIMVIHFNKFTGYYSVQFGEWGFFEHQRFPIHRLVATHFVDNPNNFPEVNHIDGDKGNNHFTNLQWVTREQNIQHGFVTGLIETPKGQNHVCAKLTNEAVLQIFNSPLGPRELSRKLNLPYSTVAAIRTGASWNHITGMPHKRKHKSTA
jgi:hypothetical protein